MLFRAFEAGGNEDAVLAGQRDEVGDGAERDQVEQRAQVEIRRARQARFASALHQGVGELEGEAGGAEFGEEVLEFEVLSFRSTADSPARTQRGRIGNLMMIEHDHIHARSRSQAMVSTAVEPQSTASSRVAGNFLRQFSTPSWLRP